ncbi:MAG: cren protein [Thermofilaceae archaeon]
MVGKEAVSIRLENIADLARLASAMVSVSGGVYIMHFEYEGKHYYGLVITMRDYYELNGVPLFYYVETQEKLKGNYILVKVDDGGEKIEIHNGIRAGWICIPIVSVAKKPEFINM